MIDYWHDAMGEMSETPDEMTYTEHQDAHVVSSTETLTVKTGV